MFAARPLGMSLFNPQVFGVVLSPLLREIPHVLTCCSRYFDEHDVYSLEGVFRVPGSHANIQTLKEKFDKGQRPDLNKEAEPHDVAGLLKLYFRELPEPLLTFEMYEPFLVAAEMPDLEANIKSVGAVLALLPRINILVMKLLLSILQRIAQKSEKNKMTPSNLAIVFAPSLLRAPADLESSQSINDVLKDGPIATKLMELFIIHYDELFSKEFAQMEEIREEEEQKAEEESKAEKEKEQQQEKEVIKPPPRPPRAPVERSARKALIGSGNRKVDFSTYLLRHSARVAFRPIGVEEFVCNDNGQLAATCTHQNGLTCFSSKKEMFQIEWYGTYCALINYVGKTKNYLSAQPNGSLEFIETPKDQEHIFEIMSEEEILTIRNIPLNKFIGFVEGGKKKNLLGIVDDMNKHPFRLNLKVAFQAPQSRKFITANALQNSPHPGGLLTCQPEMFLVQVEQPGKVCSFAHWDLKGKRYTSTHGDGWKLVSVSKKPLSDTEMWTIDIVEKPVDGEQLSFMTIKSLTKQLYLHSEKGKLIFTPDLDETGMYKIIWLASKV